MSYIASNHDGSHAYSSLTNHGSPFTSSPQESRSRAMSKGSLSSHEWLSPASTISTESNSSPYGTSADHPYAAMRYPADTYHASYPPHQNSLFQAMGDPDPYNAHQSTSMWRTASAGTALSQCIDSLALADHDKVSSNTFFSIPNPFTKQDLDSDAVFPVHHFVKSEPEATFPSYHGHCGLLAAPAMLSSVSLPGYANNTLERRMRMADVESPSSISSPSAASDATGPSLSTKRGAKRKEFSELTNLPLDRAFESPLGAKSTKKGSKLGESRRPPPSASHITEAGNPFPTIDTSAKHSSLFVAPDTSGLTKREARLVKNRAAAFLSRQRKREQFEEMEIKCKAISMLVYRMWESVAGSDASVDRIASSALAPLLAQEDPSVRAILEEVITKQGASIAPTGDAESGDGYGNGDRSQSPALFQPQNAPAPPTALNAAHLTLQQELESARNEISRLRADLAASVSGRAPSVYPSTQFDSTLSHQTSNSWLAPTPVPIRPFLPHSMSMPFRGSKVADVSLYSTTDSFASGPSSPTHNFGFGHSASGLVQPAMSEGGFDIGKTPTLSMFRDGESMQTVVKSQALQRKTAPSAGLGLEHPCDCSEYNQMLMPPLSSNPVHLMSLLLVVAGIQLMTGLGGAAQDTASMSSGGKESQDRAAGKPSSHLSEDDLQLDVDLNTPESSDHIPTSSQPPKQRRIRRRALARVTSV